MAEQVQTGGVMQFDYKRQKQAGLDPERRSAIEIGYAQADERKRRERKSKIIFWIVVILIMLLILIYKYWKWQFVYS